jgi:ABC-type xylose transport system substrate-binding protein
MLNVHHGFRPREAEVASKVIDGEAIIINLANGVYYSMEKVGALVWDLLQAGRTLEQVIEAVTARYDVTREQAEANIHELVQELVQENLVVSSEDGDAAAAEEIADGTDKLTYDPPKLNIYRDMGDLLALDPPVPGLGDTPWKDPDDPSK